MSFKYRNFLSLLSQHCNISEQHASYIIEHSAIKNAKKGESLLMHGDDCNAIWYINRGIGRYEPKNSNDEIYTAQFFAENEFATDYEKFLTGAKAGVTLTPLEDMEVIELSRALINWFMANVPGAPFFMLKQMEYYNIKCNQRIAINSEPEKIIAYQKLVALYPDIEQRVSQKIIASYLDISPVHLSRIKSEAIRR